VKKSAIASQLLRLAAFWTTPSIVLRTPVSLSAPLGLRAADACWAALVASRVVALTP
jgi:hypothetical protein